MSITATELKVKVLVRKWVGTQNYPFTNRINTGCPSCELLPPTHFRTNTKVNLGKYLMLAETEDIYITRNGKVVAKLSNPYQDRVEVAKSLFGVLPADVTLEEAREERLNTV